MRSPVEQGGSDGTAVAVARSAIACRQRTSGSAGFTLIEVLVGASISFAGLIILITTTGTALELVSVNHDSVIAMQAARKVIETLSSYDSIPFRNVFASFNQIAGDDPGGPGTAPGAFFAVPGLRLQANDPDGFVGEIRFPVGAGGGSLREDVFGRDLNGDHAIDNLDHSTDYLLLPVTIRLEWKCGSRDRSLELQTMLVGR